MYWADEIAEQVIAQNPDAEVYTCASGISPSGEVHMGNLREVITSWFVVKALQDKGKKTRFVFVWDNYDGLRKVPLDQDQEYVKYVKCALTQIPDPHGCHKSWAEHFEQPFVDSLKELGVKVEHIDQTERYLSGYYSDSMITAVQKRKQIYDIIMSFKTQDENLDDREHYYPVQIYCPECHKHTTTVLGDRENGAVLDFECKCGYKGAIDLRTQHNAKLVWKVDWPMRWAKEHFDFEPGGKDHSTEGGSFQVASAVVGPIFNGKPPLYRGYEFVGIKGTNGKMSSSKGNVMTPAKMLKVFPPEIILWLYTRFLPEKCFDISLDEDVLRTYHEFDRMYAQYKSGEADEVVKRIMEMALSCRGEDYENCPVSAQNISAFAPIVNFDLDMLVELLNKMGDTCTREQIEDRFNRISFWLQNYCPESISKLLDEVNTEFANSLNDEERGWVKKLVAEIKSKDLTQEEMQTLLYDIPKINGEPDKTRQRRFFEIVYNLLLGKSKGPRLYLFLTAIDKESLIKLLSI